MSALSVGYAVALERLPPRLGVELAARAAEHGFVGTSVSDPFQPWTPQNGEAGFAWTVLGALGGQTVGPLSTTAATIGYRMHPAAVAQASATVASLFPGRHWLGVGAGDAVSEHVVGEYWPEVPERINRLFEGVEVVKKLFRSGLTGKDVRHSGSHFKLEASRLWTMPETAPKIVVSTAGPVTARRAGRHADGIMTIGTDLQRAADLLTAFDAGWRESGRAPGAAVKAVRLDLAWAPTDEAALLAAATNWPIAGLRIPRGDIRSPYEIALLTRTVRESDLRERLTVSADPDVHRAAVQRYVDLGFTDVHLLDVGDDPDRWIDVIGSEVVAKIRP